VQVPTGSPRKPVFLWQGLLLLCSKATSVVFSGYCRHKALSPAKSSWPGARSTCQPQLCGQDLQVGPFSSSLQTNLTQMAKHLVPQPHQQGVLGAGSSQYCGWSLLVWVGGNGQEEEESLGYCWLGHILD
jgi:hypothetical protein